MPLWTTGKKKKSTERTYEDSSNHATCALDQQLERTPRHLSGFQVATEQSASRERPIFKTDRTEGEYQLMVLHDPEQAEVDIVFIHGLTGNRENTWTRNPGKKNACFWPADLLPEPDSGIPNARIMTWGYDADVVHRKPFSVVSNNTIEQHAANLCTDLANIRGGHKASRPLLFVVHSLGGLVVKTALLHANESRIHSMSHLSAVVDSTAGILFMGTPHRGSEQAQWGGILATVLGYAKQDNAELVNRLNKEEPRLVILQERFSKLLETRKETHRPIDITCFYEELPVPVLGTIVPALSAQMDPYPAISIHANHMDMTNFGGDDSAGYLKVLGELRRFVRSATDTNRTTKGSQEGDFNLTDQEGETKSAQGIINFNGRITGRNVISGSQTTNGGTTNFTFN